MPKLKNILNTIADELFSVDNGGDRPVTVNDLRLIVTALIKEIKEDEERANDRLTQGKLARLKQELYEPTSFFDPDSIQLSPQKYPQMSDLTARRYPDKYPAFITGSRELGSFKSGSDIDLVIFVDDPKVKASLKANSNHKGTPIYYGSLNLLICDTPEEYLFWRKALDLCKEKQSLLCRHLTKQERCEIHETLAEQLGIPFKNGKPTDYDAELF